MATEQIERISEALSEQIQRGTTLNYEAYVAANPNTGVSEEEFCSALALAEQKVLASWGYGVPPGKLISREAFNQLSPLNQGLYMKDGGRLIEEEKKPGRRRDLSTGTVSSGGRTITRGEFDRMSQSERMAFARLGK